MSQIFFGIAPWKIVKDEPRHNTWHHALNVAAKSQNIRIYYFGHDPQTLDPWIFHVFSNSIFRRFRFLDPRTFLNLVNKVKLLSSRDDHKIFYIFEGSFFWWGIFILLNPFVSNATFICNLFSSSAYNEKFFPANNSIRSKIYVRLVKIVSRLNPTNIIFTFDTQLMSEKTSMARILKAKTFPVPGSFNQKPEILKKNDHFRVIVNLRSFDFEELLPMFENSCLQCKFVIPRGPLGRNLDQIKFKKFKNVEFESENISVANYEEYTKGFDYIVLLYKPSLDASGRLLDAMLMNVGVCLPSQATEWVYLAEDWGYSYQFDWNCASKDRNIFNHPNFAPPKMNGSMPFSPINSLYSIGNFDLNSPIKNSWPPMILKKTLVFLILMSWYPIALCLNIRFFSRITEFIRKRH